MRVEILDKYYTELVTEMTSFVGRVYLSLKGIETLSKILLCQYNLLSLLLSGSVQMPACIKILCDSICKHNCNLTQLALPSAELSVQELDSIGGVISTLKSLESLNLRGLLDYGTSLNSSNTFCTALRDTKCLKNFSFGGFRFSEDDLLLFSDIISKNCSLKKLTTCEIADVKVIMSILKGLSSNQSITYFKTWPDPCGTSHKLGQQLGKCLASNQTLISLDFTSTSYQNPIQYVQWSSVHVCCIFTGLLSNNTLVTLDISGCHVDNTAGNALCTMLSQNTSLKHLFLNPVHLTKLQASSIFQSCVNNATLELLTLYWLPGRQSVLAPCRSLVHQPKVESGCIPLWSPQKELPFAEDKEIIAVLDEVHKCRQERTQPSLEILWYVTNNVLCS